MSKVIKLEIFQESFFLKFLPTELITFPGLLVKAYYDDGSSKILSDPFLDYPQTDELGTYDCVIYPSKQDKSISISFKFYVVDEIRYDDYTNKNALTLTKEGGDRVKSFAINDEENPIVMKLLQNPDSTITLRSNIDEEFKKAKATCTTIISQSSSCGSPCSGNTLLTCPNCNDVTTCGSSASCTGCNGISVCGSSSSCTTCNAYTTCGKSSSCSTCSATTTCGKSSSCTGCSDTTTCGKSSSCTGCSDISTCGSSSSCTTCDSVTTCGRSSDCTGCSSIRTCGSSSSCTTCSSTTTCGKSSSCNTCDSVSTCGSSSSCSCTASGMSACISCPSSGSATTKDINIEVQDTQGRKSQVENVTSLKFDNTSKTVGIGYWRSNNYNKASTTAEMTSNSVALNSGDKITIDYYVLSESSYDKLNIYIYKDGSQVDSVTDSGYNSGWSTKTYNVTSSGNYSLKVQYVKDSSNNYGADRAWVRRPYYHINGVNYLFEFTNTGSYGFDELRYQKI